MGRWGCQMTNICRSLLDLLSSIAKIYQQTQFVSIGCGDGSLEAAIGAFTHTRVLAVDLAEEQITHSRAMKHVEYIHAMTRNTCVTIPETAVLLFVFPTLGFKLFCRYADSFYGVIVLIGDDTCKPQPSATMPEGWYIAERHEVLKSGIGTCQLLVLVRTDN